MSIQTNFTELNLSEPIYNALSILSFNEMTPVQSSTIPLFLKNKDVIVEAVTGSGKTLAFIIPILEILLKRCHQDHQSWKKNEIGAIVISPTRELAKQIDQVCHTFVECINTFYSKSTGYKLSQALFIGGSSVDEDVAKFNQFGANILIGTPGRLQDLLTRHASIFKTRSVEVLILDEADKLLDMGFFHSLNDIIKTLPKQRRTGLFSATMSEGLNELVRAGLRNPVKVVVKVENLSSEQRTPSSLNIYYHFTPPDMKLSWLFDILLKELDKKYILYFSTCAIVDYYFKIFSQLSYATSPFKLFSLHGKMDPKRREAVYEKYTMYKGGCILLCTDVAARGLDIPDIDIVIQYDPPQDEKAFAHRCGRTARMGKEGKAIVFLDPKEDTYIEFLSLRKVPLEPLVLESQEPSVSCNNILQELIKLNKSDRDLYEKSIKAFVSWVRSYNEHQANFIFNLKNIDLGKVAKAFGLFRLPKMPELKISKTEFQVIEVNVNEIPYKDPAREKQRKSNLASNNSNQGQGIKRKKAESWSDQKEAKQKRLERKEKKEKRRIAIAKAKEQGTFVPKPKKTVDEDDWLEMQKEARKLKKSKNLKNKKTNDSSDESINESSDEE